MRRSVQRLIAAGLLALTLITGYAYRDTITLTTVFGQQLASDPGGGGGSGGDGG